MSAKRIQMRRDTAANWTSENPLLSNGEWGLEIDTGRKKIGDGTTYWTSLPYENNQNMIFPADTTTTIQSKINTSKDVYFSDGTYILTSTLTMALDNLKVEFSPNAVINMTGKNFPAITFGVASGAVKPVNMKLYYPKTTGDKTAGSNGVLLKGAGEDCEIFGPYLAGCEAGIKTDFFDCFQINSIYEPFLLRNTIGLDDTNGGLQACRIYGGRIESNTKGIIWGSPNVKFFGTMIEGNTDYEIALKNQLILSSVYSCGGTLSGVYFEHYTNPCIVTINADNGWFGELDFLGCHLFIMDTQPLISISGDAFNVTSSEKKINMFGCLCGSDTKQLFNLPNVGIDTYINLFGVTMTGVGATPYNHLVNDNAKIFGLDRSGNIIGGASVRATSFQGGDFGDTAIQKPASYFYGYKMILEPLNSSGGSYGEISMSNISPWTETGTGVLPGSLHFNYTAKKWYQRITANGGVDAEANWGVLTYTNQNITNVGTDLILQLAGSQIGAVKSVVDGTSPNSYGMETYVTNGGGATKALSINRVGDLAVTGTTRATSFQGGLITDVGTYKPASYYYGYKVILEPLNSSSGNYSEVSISSTKPWLEANVGILPGSLHFCTANKRWYQRFLPNFSSDVETNWSILSLGLENVTEYSGTVGIYTAATPTAWDSGYNNLQVGGVSSFVGDNLGAGACTRITNNAYYASGWKHMQNDECVAYIQTNGTHSFYGATAATPTAAISWNEALHIDVSGNVGLGTETFGTNATKTLGIVNGVAPSDHVDNSIQIYSKDAVAGGSTLGLFLEADVVVETDETKFSHKVPVIINGTEYFMMLCLT